MSDRTSKWLLNISLLLCLGYALAMRFIDLNHIPGLSGDEAWMPMQIRYFLNGENFTLKTPTHRWVSPTFAIVQGLFQLLPWTGIGILRLPTALASAAAVLAIPFLFRKLLPRNELIVFMLLVACMPIQIAYARVLGEMSQVPLAMVILLALIARGKIYWALLVFGIATTIHPTCMLAFPILFFGVGGDPGWRTRLNLRVILLGLVLIAAMIFWQWDTLGWRLKYTASMFYLQVTNVFSFIIYLIGILRVFTGSNVAQNFVSTVSSEHRMWTDLAAGLLLGFIFGYGTYLLKKSKKYAQLWNLAGTALAFLVLYLIAAPAEPPFEPGFERYALYLMVPLALQVSVLLYEIFQTHKFHEKKWLAGTTVIFIAMLLNFKIVYFDAARKGGDAYFTYKTGEEDPKYAAYQWIKKDQAENKRGKIIVAETWWCYWPMVYFDSPDPQFEIKYLDPHGFRSNLEANAKAPTTEEITDLVYGTLKKGGYLVGFKGEFIDRNFKPPPSVKILRQDFLGYSGDVLFSVWRWDN